MVKRLDDIDLSQFEDYESEDLDQDEAADADEAASRGRNDYVGQMWGRYGYTGSTRSRAEDLVTAHKMVQTFVDTFATPGNRYRIAFDPSISTAGTDLTGRAMSISPAPVFDPTLTPQQAGVIMTGMAVHEVSHDRYGRTTLAAVVRIFGRKRAPTSLSNILDDVRIERRFAADYPGYSDVFRPMMDYVAKSTNDRENLDRARPEMTDILNLAVMAIRYPRHADWATQELRDERDWWQAWAAKWSREDSPRRHVEAVREGLKHIVATQKKIERKKAKFAVSMPAPPVDDPQKRFHQALEKLTPLAQRAMRMSSEGRSGDEIAATLGLKMETTRSLLREARRQLALAMRGEGLRERVFGSRATDVLSGVRDGLREGRL